MESNIHAIRGKRSGRYCAHFRPLTFLALAALCGQFDARLATAQFDGITITQGNLDLDDDTVDVTSFGTVQVDAATLTSTFGISSGYLNLVDSSGNWVTENLPVSSTDGFDAGSIDLETPDGQTDTLDGLKVSFTPAPLFTPPNTGPTLSFSITPQTANNGGFDGGAAGAISGPTLSFSLSGVTYSASQAGIPNVQSADNQCGPAAIANDLTWLATQYGVSKGVTIPNPNVTGRYGQTSYNSGVSNTLVPNGNANSTSIVGGPLNNPKAPQENAAVAPTPLVANLDQTMGRLDSARAPVWVYNGVTTKYADANAGVVPSLIVQGAAQYIANVGDTNKLGIYTQGTYLFAHPAATTAGVAVAYNNSVPTMTTIINALADGDTVMGGYYYTNGGGHAIDIIAAGYTNGVPWLKLQSDWAQTRSNPNGDPLDGLLTTNGSSAVKFSYVQPTAAGLTLNDGYGNASLQTIIVMYPIGNAVPEPSTWALLITGGIGLAVAQWRRRHRGH
jgi:hypothetical protein